MRLAGGRDARPAQWRESPQRRMRASQEPERCVHREAAHTATNTDAKRTHERVRVICRCTSCVDMQAQQTYARAFTHSSHNNSKVCTHARQVLSTVVMSQVVVYACGVLRMGAARAPSRGARRTACAVEREPAATHACQPRAGAMRTPRSRTHSQADQRQAHTRTRTHERPPHVLHRHAGSPITRKRCHTSATRTVWRACTRDRCWPLPSWAETFSTRA